jgi:hypothetical protein
VSTIGRCHRLAAANRLPCLWVYQLAGAGVSMDSGRSIRQVGSMARAGQIALLLEEFGLHNTGIGDEDPSTVDRRTASSAAHLDAAAGRYSDPGEIEVGPPRARSGSTAEMALYIRTAKGECEDVTKRLVR